MERRSSAFSLGELAAILLILTFTGSILYPVFVHSREPKSRGSCYSNLRQINLALRQYLQDHDETLPPAGEYQPGSGGNAVGLPGYLNPYITNQRYFHCRSVRGTEGLTYLYNDLVASAALNQFSGLAHTIVVAEGEDMASNTGHAWMPDVTPLPATINRHGLCDPNQGATVKEAPLRHAGGANYLFADGHVQSLQPNVIFFPDRRTNHRAHRLEGHKRGPDPAGDMLFDGVKYMGTFHMK